MGIEGDAELTALAEEVIARAGQHGAASPFVRETERTLLESPDW
jgi:hypothetical protein